MARTIAQRQREQSLAVRSVPAGVRRADRMARFAAVARRALVRAVTVGGLLAAGWLLAVVFQMLTAAPAAADSTAATGAGSSLSAVASDNAQAMAGLTVDGLTSQSDHGLPSPGPTGQVLDTDGLVPTGGASGPFGPGMGDVARYGFDPRLDVRRVAPAYVQPPVVRAAVDDPSFSPD